MSNEIQKANPTEVSYALPNGDNITLDAETVKNYLVKGNGQITDKEVVLFVNLCKAQRLNPFFEVHLIKYSNNSPISIVVTKDAFFNRAESHPQYEGFKSGIIILTKEGKIIEREGAFHLPNESVVGGWAKVYRKDRKTEIYDSVSYDEYAAKDSNGNINSNWRTKPGTMIQKVAEVHALRKAFPERLSGMYIEDEMGKSQVISTMEMTEDEVKPYDLSGMDEAVNEIHEDTFESYNADDGDAMDEFMATVDEPEEEPAAKSNEPFEVPYAEFSNHKSKYKLVAGSYNADKKTCMVTLK